MTNSACWLPLRLWWYRAACNWVDGAANVRLSEQREWHCVGRGVGSSNNEQRPGIKDAPLFVRFEAGDSPQRQSITS
ncbi:MAG: hypothetical protein IPG25_15260 [Proteobacteria bacterium]|nr:hypothetical protein [Pseudomonadota bacterium]